MPKSKREQLIEDYELQVHYLSLDLIDGKITEEEYDAEIAELKISFKLEMGEEDEERS